MNRTAIRFALVVMIVAAGQSAIASKTIARRHPPRCRARGSLARMKRRKSGAIIPRPLSMCCRGRRGRKTCRKARFGVTRRDPISPAASGCPTPDMASLRPIWPAISLQVSTRRRMAITLGFWFYIASPIAGCRGMRPSAPARSAIPMSSGIPKERMAGSPPVFQCSRPNRNRGRINKRSANLFRRRLQIVLNRVAQIEQPFLDQDRHVADVRR